MQKLKSIEREVQHQCQDMDGIRIDIYWADEETGQTPSEQICKPDFVTEVINGDQPFHSSQPTTIDVVINYPLKAEHVFTLSADKPITKKNFVEFLQQTYQRIYREEEETAQTQTWILPTNNESKEVFAGKVLPEEFRTGLINRHQTEGKYGIWGHDIEDLHLEQIWFNPTSGQVRLGIGS